MSLREHQIKALGESGFRPGFAFFMEQGLGKTFTVLTEFEELVKHYGADLLVVICPNSFKTGWKKEAEKHHWPYPVHVYEASRHRHVEKAINAEPVAVLIINYEAIRLGKTQKLIHDLTDNRRGYIAFDESIHVKNNRSAQTKACIAVSKLFEWKRVLSGKPITQGPHDLWGQLRCIGELDGKNFYAFRNRFCIMGGYMGKQVVGPRNEEELSALLNTMSFQARKEDWLKHLPPKSYTERQIKLHPDVGSIYEEMQELFVAELADGSVTSADMVLTRLLRQSQIASGFIVTEEGDEKEIVPLSKNTRLQYALEYKEEISGKLVLVTRFRRTARELFKLFKDFEPTYIVGGMSQDEIEKQKSYFNEGRSEVIILNAQAAKYGHTLHASGAASDMLFVENDYNLDTRSQIEDRIHRDGQPNACLYCDMYSTGLDYEIVGALQRKEDVAAKILGYERTMFGG